MNANYKNNSDELFENLRDGVVTVDSSGRILICNKAYERITGYSEQELKKLTYQDLTPKKWHDFEQKIIQEQTLKKGYSEIYEKEYRRKDGTILPIELQTYILRDESGKFAGLQGVVRDISDRKHAETTLRMSEERFRLLFEYAPVGIVVQPYKEKLKHTNAAFQQMLGYSAEELSQLTIEDITFPDDLEKSREKIELLASGKVDNYQIEKRYVRKDGTVIWGKGSGSLVRNASIQSEFAIGVIVDITEQKQAYIKEMKAREEAEKTIKLRDDFLSIASHELRTPLTPLFLGIDYLKRLINMCSQNFPEKEKMEAAIIKSYQHIKRIQDLVEFMLLTLRINTGQLVLSLDSCDLSELIHKTIERHQLELTKCSSQLNLNLKKGLCGKWDHEMLQQVIWTLLENAIKFGQGKPIEIASVQIENRAKVSVQDHGIGIKMPEQGRIFERFERVSSIQNYGGFGLGLYIAKQIIVKHGGTINCESEIAKGTTITFELPLEN